jgi:hypothetical protein
MATPGAENPDFATLNPGYDCRNVAHQMWRKN